MSLEETRKTNKINLKHKSKSKKSHGSRKNDGKKAGDKNISFQQRIYLNLSQMFNYLNYPIMERQTKKSNKNSQHAYRSYTSSSVSKQKKPSRSKNYGPPIFIAANQRGRYTSTNHSHISRKDDNFKSRSKHKSSLKGTKSIRRNFMDLIKQMDKRSYSRVETTDNYSSAKRRQDYAKQPLNFLFHSKGAHPSSAKKRKKSSSKRVNYKEDSGSRLRSRDRIENKTMECNSAINTYQNSTGRKDHSPLSFVFNDRMVFENDENLSL